MPKAVFALIGPTIVSQLITMVYNLADTFFVGQTNDPNQVAAVSLAFPAYMTLTAVCNLFGVGGASAMSRALGRKEPDKAGDASAFCFWAAALTTLAYSAIVLLLEAPFARLLGADASTLDYTKNYLTWVLVIGGVPTVMGVMLGHLVRAEGDSRQASIGISLGGILNIILDPIFIFPFGFGLEVKGAAIATMLSNVASMVYFIVVIRAKSRRRETVISFSPSRAREAGKDTARQVISTGLPAACQTMLAMFSNAMLNNRISVYNSTAVAAAGISKKIDMLPMNVTMGISQGVLPIIGYNYASGDHDRMRSCNAFARTVATVFALCCVAGFEVFAPQIVGLFIKDAQTVAYGTVFLRAACLATPCMALTFIITSMFQATGHGNLALTLSVFRKGVLDIPLMFLFDRIWPMYGLLWVQPVMDSLAIGLAFILYARFNRRLAAAEAAKADMTVPQTE